MPLAVACLRWPEVWRWRLNAGPAAPAGPAMGDVGESRALLWSLPLTFFDKAAVAATHGSGFAVRTRYAPRTRGALRAAVSDSHSPSHSGDLADTQPGGSARGDAGDESAAGRTDAWKESGFATLEEWRAYTKTDLFRFNAKRRAAGRAALTGASQRGCMPADCPPAWPDCRPRRGGV